MYETKKIFFTLLTAAMLLPYIPAAAQETSADTAQTSAPALTESGEAVTSNAATIGELFTMLRNDGDVSVKITADLSFMLEQSGLILKLGKGSKIIDLNGHNIIIRNDSLESNSSTLFEIGEGSSLVMNDSSVTISAGSPYIDSGYITYYNYSAGDQVLGRRSGKLLFTA